MTATTTRPHVTVEPRWASKVLVRATQIIGTDEVRFSAWEPTGKLGENTHGSITSLGGDSWYGRVGTAAPGAWLEQLEPGSDQRVLAVAEHYRYDKARAVVAILVAFPGLVGHGRIDEGSGEVACTVEQMATVAS